jgi:MFS family permease
LAELATAVEPRRRAWLAWSRSPSTAVTAVFFVSGVLFASWTAHIPHIKEYLRLNDGMLGLALLGAPVGSVIAMLVVARLMPRYGSRLICRVMLTGYCLAGPLVGLAGSAAMLFLALMLWGAFQGTLDVSMNTQAISVERQARRPLMSGFHGAWSIGAFAGAGLGAAGVAIGLSLSDQLLLLATPCLLIGGWLSLAMIPDQHPVPDQQAEAPRKSGSRSARIAIGVLAGIIVADTLCEGAVGDWAAVYLHASLGAAVAVAALGYTAYSLTMVAVRLAGNRLLGRFAANKLLPALAGPAAVLFAVGLAVNDIPAMLLGFAALGAGLAAVYPVVMTASGRVPGIHSGTAVALVAAFGWVGLLSGPVVIGQIANATSLRLALILVIALTALVAVATGTCRVLRPD